MTAMFDLAGKVALVTGANTGIGQAIAVALADAGADVAAAGRSPADETVARVRDAGRQSENFAADLSSTAAVQPLVDASAPRAIPSRRLPGGWARRCASSAPASPKTRS